MFYITCGVQLLVPQAMEKTWVLFGSLQIFNIATQLNLKVPTNVKGLANYLQESANSQLIDNANLYGWLRALGSDKNETTYESSTLNQTNSTTSRMLNATADDESLIAKTSAYQDSKFYGHGSTEKVIESAAAMLVALVLLFCAFLSLLFFQKFLLHWLPVKVKEAFFSIKRRFYFSLPLRILS